MSASARPRIELGSHGSRACALAYLPGCSNASAVVDQVEVDGMLRPAAREVTAAAARKTLTQPYEIKGGSPATCWKSGHAGTGKALWIRLGSAPPWRVSGQCGPGWPGAHVDERPWTGDCKCAWQLPTLKASRPDPFAETCTPSPRRASPPRRRARSQSITLL